MGIAVLAAARLVQVVPGWIGSWKPRMASNRGGRLAAHPGRNDAEAGWHSIANLAGDLFGRLTQRRPPSGATIVPPTARGPAAPRPLRVLRVLEPQQPRAAAGRMVISGRMADVCAELDRLAAAEAASRP